MSDYEDDSENENENYDSMIENGTSEEESDSDNVEEEAVESENDVVEEKEEVPKKVRTKKRKNTESLAVPSKKSKSADLARPPTLEEINQLNETQNLFHSNLFRFQIEEMLNEINISKKQYRAIDEWLEKFNLILDTLKSDTKYKSFDKVVDKIRKKFSVELPIDVAQFEEYRTKEQNFQFFKPNKAKVMGSARQRTLVGPNLVVDLCVEMPKEVFAWKINEDHLNGNYLQKRTFYLCILAAKLAKDSEIYRTLKFSCWQNDELNPILVIEPIGERLENRVKFNLRIVCDEESFKVSRFSPITNNARTKRGDNLSETDLAPTPSYNSIVLQDLRAVRNEEFIDDVIQASQNIRDAIKLLKIWLRQRHLDDDGGLGMNGFVVTMLVCYLIQSKKVSKSMSSYQIVRTVWNCLAVSEWTTAGITLWRPPYQTSPPSLQLFHEYFDCVFTDQSGYLNILHNFNVDVYNRIRYESQTAIKILNDLKVNSFKSLFMMKMPVFLQYDHIVSITNYGAIKINKNDNPFGNRLNKILKKVCKQKNHLNFMNFSLIRLFLLLRFPNHCDVHSNHVSFQ